MAKKTIDQVFVRYIVRTAPELKSDDLDMEEEIPEPHIELGYQYHSRAVTNSKLPSDSVASNPSTARAEPGTMAHHVMIQTRQGENEKPYPIADLMGHGFVLLIGHEGIGWARAARNVNLEEGEKMPDLAVYELNSSDTNSKFYEKYNLTPAGCVLIRPDGFVAWTEKQSAVSGFGGIGMPGPEERLKCVLKDILCLAPPPYKSESTKDAHSGHHANMSVARSNTTKAQDASLANTIFVQRKRLQDEKTDLQAKSAAVDSQLADLDRMSALQNEMAMLAMKMRFAK